MSAESLPGERQASILQLLRDHGRVVASQLAERFGVSEDSIRRDLRELDARGLCRRIHGGALPATPDFPALRQRQQVGGDRKQALARAAVALLRPGQVLLLDAGSTNSAIARALPADAGLRVITNAPDIAMELMGREGIDLVLLGGRVDRRIGAAVGAQTLEALAHLRADVCFVGACALDAEGTVWAVDDEEAACKRALVVASDRCVVVVTNEKLGARASCRVAAAGQVDAVVVEADAPSGMSDGLRALGLDVHCAAVASD